MSLYNNNLVKNSVIIYNLLLGKFPDSEYIQSNLFEYDFFSESQMWSPHATIDEFKYIIFDLNNTNKVNKFSGITNESGVHYFLRISPHISLDISILLTGYYRDEKINNILTEIR